MEDAVTTDFKNIEHTCTLLACSISGQGTEQEGASKDDTSHFKFKFKKCGKNLKIS